MGSLTHFPNGVSSFGIPVPAGIGVPYQPNGNVWWVNDGASGSGTSPEDAFGTIQGAVDRAIAGDTIMVFSGSYDETVTITANYISIIGAQLGGYGRPDLAPAAGVALIVSGQGFTTRHMRFVSADSDSVQWHGNGGAAIDCVFDGAAGQAATEANLRLVGATDSSHSASENLFLDCLFRGSTSGAGIIFQYALAAAGGAAVTDNQIINCRFYANGVDLLSATNTNGGGAGIFLNLLVTGCQFLTVGASYVYMDMDQGAAGDLAVNSCLISNNWFADEALISAQIDITGQANAMFVGNYDAAGLVNGSTFNN